MVFEKIHEIGAKKSSTKGLNDKPVVFHPKLLFLMYVCVVYARRITKIWNLMKQNELAKSWVRNSRCGGLHPSFHMIATILRLHGHLMLSNRCDCDRRSRQKDKNDTNLHIHEQTQRFMHALHAPHKRFSF